MSSAGRHFAVTETTHEPPIEEHHIPLWLDITATVAAAIAFAIAVRLFAVQTYKVPSGSMRETIHPGDRLVGEKVTLHWSQPAPGDIVTFEDPKGSGETLIKRVIATQGQVVDLQNGRVVVDGVELSEPYTRGQLSEPINPQSEDLKEPITYPYTVPSGYIWVMGDNRMNSLDSRYFGPVPLDSVTAKALFIYWPPSNVAEL